MYTVNNIEHSVVSVSAKCRTVVIAPTTLPLSSRWQVCSMGSSQSSKQQTQQSKRVERVSKTASDRHFQTRLLNRVEFQALITSDT